MSVEMYIENICNHFDNVFEDDEVDIEKIWDGAFHGFMEKLDPHSVYIPPKKQEEIDEIFRGKFQGIGIEFDILDGYITVIAPVADSPSERVGLQPGDKIIEIDNIKIAVLDFNMIERDPIITKNQIGFHINLLCFDKRYL